MYSLCKDYEEQDHKNKKNMEWLDSYLNLERMLRSLKTLIDDFLKKKDYIAYVGLCRKEYEYTFNGVGNYFYCSPWKTDFLKIIMNTMKIIKKHLQKDVFLMKKRKKLFL